MSLCLALRTEPAATQRFVHEAITDLYFNLEGVFIAAEDMPEELMD